MANIAKDAEWTKRQIGDYYPERTASVSTRPQAMLYELKTGTALAFRRGLNVLKFRMAGKRLHVAFTNPRIGMFAQMNFCLYMAQYAAQHRLRLWITLNSENYIDPARGPNWFDYYLCNRDGVAEGKPDAQIIRHNGELPFRAVIPSRREANRLFFQQYSVRPELAGAVEDFAARHGIGPRTLGVHYRGTDKNLEADPVATPHAIEAIKAAISPATRNVFVASDQASFLSEARQDLRDIDVISHDDSVRSSDGAPVHLGSPKVGNYAMGRDAFINALLLARCGHLVRTASTLSAWSLIFNPEITATSLNRPKRGNLWFPETLAVQDAPLP